MNIELAVATAITLTSGFITYLVVGANKKSIVNRTFGYFIISTIIWIISLYLSNHVLSQALFWTKWTFLGAAFIALFLFYFALVFPEKEKGLSPTFEILILLPALTIAYLLSFTDFIIKGITYIATGTGVEQGSLYLIWPIYFLSFIITALTILIKKYKQAYSIVRTQLKFMLWGLSLALVIAVTTNLIFPLLFKNDALSNYGPYAVFIFIGFTAYAITKHALFDIRVIATEVLVALLSLVLLVQVLLNPSNIINWVLLFLAVYIGYLLIKSVLKEISQRQELFPR